MCKVNFAVYVSGIMPWRDESQRPATSLGATKWLYYLGAAACVGLVSAYIDLHYGINVFTFPYDQTHTGSEGRRASTTGQPEPASGTGRRSAVPHVGLLRCARPGAGQVRDGATGARGWTPRQPQRGGLRLLSSFVLSGPGAVGQRRTGRARASQTRPPPLPQARPKGDGIPRAGAVRGCLPATGGSGGSSPATVPSHGASTQHRAGAGATGKKHP